MIVGADRCVLRADNKLPIWVKVRPYDDIKVGERAITIGTPQGLGAHRRRRPRLLQAHAQGLCGWVQTSAP